MSEAGDSRVLGVVVCDFDRTAIGTRSRLADRLPTGHTVIETVFERLLRVKGVGEFVALVPTEQMERARVLLAGTRVRVVELVVRPASISGRVRAGRAWNLLAWRGGAGQWTVFDEEYHPAAIAGAAAAAFDGKGAEHVLVVHSHGIFLDVAMTAALVQHHLHKNHEMRVTFTPAAPGLSGMVLRADIVKEMGEKGVMPGQLLAYDTKAPTFDTLIRDACMQVDPALSKIPNRFCVDTCRSEAICRELAERTFGSSAEMCLAAARGIAPGVSDFSRVHDWPRELEIELTAERLTNPPGYLPEEQRHARAPLDAAHWVQWFGRQGDLRTVCDDLLVTFGGDGDPLLGPGLSEVLRAARHAGALSICVQTDLAGGDIDGLIGAIGEGLVDVVSVTTYGHTAATYARVAGADLHAAVMKNMERLSEVTRSGAGVPLVVPRLLKVRETIPELEPFFDFWVERCGWTVIDGPTDRAGSVPFAGVVDMAPPKRRPCRRLWDRMLIRADGTAVACDQDMQAKLRAGHIESHSIPEMWQALRECRGMHAAGRWAELSPCSTCREWHRA